MDDGTRPVGEEWRGPREATVDGAAGRIGIIYPAGGTDEAILI